VLDLGWGKERKMNCKVAGRNGFGGEGNTAIVLVAPNCIHLSKLMDLYAEKWCILT
jgi:hypothetical protein